MTKIQWLPLVLGVVQAALMLALGLAGEAVRGQLGMDTTTYLLVTALLVFVLLAANARLLMPQRAPGSDDAALVFPVHWGSFFPLGGLLGFLFGSLLLRLLDDGLLAGTIHTYEAVGLALGALVIILMAVRRTPIPGAAFGLGYGLALPSAVLFLDPQNDPALTYAGHLGVMVVVSLLGIVFGSFVRIQIVD